MYGIKRRNLSSKVLLVKLIVEFFLSVSEINETVMEFTTWTTEIKKKNKKKKRLFIDLIQFIVFFSVTNCILLSFQDPILKIHLGQAKKK